MPVLPVLFLFVPLTQFAASIQAQAASGHISCLTRPEQRAAVSAKRAISLAQALKLLHEQRRYSEVLRARLCRRNGRLAYVLTLIGRNGKVAVVTIDAANGEYHTGR